MLKDRISKLKNTLEFKKHPILHIFIDYLYKNDQFCIYEKDFIRAKTINYTWSDVDKTSMNDFIFYCTKCCSDRKNARYLKTYFKMIKERKKFRDCETGMPYPIRAFFYRVGKLLLLELYVKNSKKTSITCVISDKL